MENESKERIAQVDKRVDDLFKYTHDIGKVIERVDNRMTKLEDGYSGLTKDQIVMSKDIEVMKGSLDEIKYSVNNLSDVPLILNNMDKNNKKQNDVLDKIVHDVTNLKNKPAETALDIWKKIGAQVLAIVVAGVIALVALKLGL
ncbi:MAG: hypothetical protein GX995_06360 [Clostridiales bacterium]|nr:hypothetical protein [Clostridiales bacterium]